MSIWEEVRNEFPVCRKFVYLNPAGGSPISLSAANQGKLFYDEMLAHGDNLYDKWLERTEQTRQEIAAYIGAEENEMAFTTNTSHGMNLIAQINKNNGDVLTMQDEFPSSTLPWLNQNVKIKMVEPENGFEYPIEKINDAIDNSTGILMTSYVQYNTGYRQNLEALGKLCKQRGLIFVVNATQAMPVFPVDVKKCHIDFLVFTGLKWATAGYGIGGLYINKKWLSPGKLPFAGWQSTDNPEEMDNTNAHFAPRASVVEAGCPHFAPIFALKGALSLFNKIGQQQAMERVLQLNQYLHKQLKSLGFEVASPLEEQFMSGITIIKTNRAKDLVSRLKEKNIIVSARGKGIRVSVNIFNNENDIDVLMDALNHLKNDF